MKISKFLTASFLVAMIASPAVYGSEDAEIIKMIDEKVLQRLKADRPDLSFGDIKASPLEGYYEFSIANRQTIYVSENGEHFFSGELYFAEPNKFVNATEMARSSERLEQLAGISDSELIIFSPEGETKAVMNVFTDVTCGYCRKLHGQMEEMNALGIEVRYLGYPRTGIRRDGELTTSYAETSKAWCANDRLDAMTRLKAGLSVSTEACEDNPLEKHFLLGQKFGVSGTPAIIMPDGSLLPGYRSPEAYAALLGLSVE